MSGEDEDIESGTVWMGDVSAEGPSLRLIEAFARGETTEGGMAEAGWRQVGRIEGEATAQRSSEVRMAESGPTQPPTE